MKQDEVEITVNVIPEGSTEGTVDMLLCTVPRFSWFRFNLVFGVSLPGMKKFLKRWISDEYCVDINLSHERDIRIFQELVKGKARDLDREKYREGAGDEQGYVREFVIDRMRWEIVNNADR